MAKTYHGEDCKHRHGGLRYTSTRTCVVCAKDAVRKRRGNPLEADGLADLIGDLTTHIPKETDT